MTLEVSYDTVVGGADGSRSGLLGLLVFDEQASKFIAVTAASVAGDGVLLDAGGAVVGQVSGSRPDTYDAAQLRPAWTLLAPVMLPADVAIGEGRLSIQGEMQYPVLCRSPGRLLGSTVLVHLADRRAVDATLSSTSASFAMYLHDQSSAPVFFSDALELSMPGDRAEWAKNGDAGALVTTIDGTVLGVVVSAARDKAYAAPVEPLLRELGSCELLSGAILAKSRRSVGSWLSAASEVPDNAAAEQEDLGLGLEGDEVEFEWRDAEASGSKSKMLDVAEQLLEECFDD